MGRNPGVVLPQDNVNGMQRLLSATVRQAVHYTLFCISMLHRREKRIITVAVLVKLHESAFLS